MGAGKTAMALSLIRHINATRNPKSKRRTLVVAPKTVVYGTWNQEAHKWENFKDLTLALLHGKDKEKNYLMCDPDIFLINYEGLAFLDSLIKKTRLLRFDTIIFDESSKLKSPSTGRFKICKRMCNSVDRVVLLSGTPSPNSIMDLWSQYFLLDRGHRLGSGITKYRSTFFDQEGFNFKKYTPKNGAPEKVTELVSDITFRVDESELPKVPELQTNVIKFDLPNELQRRYDAIEKEMFLTIDSATQDGVDALNSASMLNLSRQFVQGFVYKDSGGDTKEAVNIHKLKLEVLQETVESLNGQPVMIAYSFKHELVLLKELFGNDIPHIGSGSKPSDISQYEKAWNDKKIPILLCNPASVSHGLNLQHGGHNIIWFSLTYSWEQYTQLIGRLHRQGQVNEVRNHILCASNTVDEFILSKLRAKELGQKLFLDLLYQYRKQKSFILSK
jgi:superfamily II DNA or RNA helicase